MKPTRRARRRQDVGRQQDQKKDQKFFGNESHQPFFQPGGVLSRAPEAKEEKKDEKISKAPEEKKEEAVSRAPAAGDKEEKKEEKVSRAADPQEEKKEKKIDKAAVEPEEKRKEEKVHKKGEAGGAGEATARYVKEIDGKGRPLPSSEQEYFGNRMGFDFSGVRIHTGAAAAESARDAQAKAYTYGNHIVFNEGKFNPESHDGRHLLAHELTHVIQKGGAAPGTAREPGGPSVGGGVPASGPGSATEGPHPGARSNQSPAGRQSAAPGHVHRDPATGAKAAATDKALFGNRMAIAIAQMKTPTVANETLSGALEPVLKEMAGNAAWVDAAGATTAGADVEVALKSGGRKVRLRLILDDNAAPPLTGRFDSSGADVGIIRVYTRDNPDADTLATTLYHESLHLMRWLAKNAPGGDLAAETGAKGGRKTTLEGIDPARQPRHVAKVRKHVADLAASVNAARKSGEQIDGAGIDRLSNFVMEEYLVRVETEVFRLMRDSDAVAATAGRGPGIAHVRGGTVPETFFPKADVDKYLFEIGPVFRAGDRAALSDYDRGRIDMLYAYFRDRAKMFVDRRYSEVIHGPEFP